VPIFDPSDTPDHKLASSAVQFKPSNHELIIACVAEICESTHEMDTPGGDATPFLPPPSQQHQRSSENEGYKNQKGLVEGLQEGGA